MTQPGVKRNVGFVLLGIAAFVLKTRYSGPFTEAVHSWGGNVSVSFAVYFMVASSIPGRRLGRFATAVVALLVVQLFEATNGFGVMTNVYDSVDFAANLAGVGVAAATDIGASKVARQRGERTTSEAGEKSIAESGGGEDCPPGSHPT